VNNSTVNHLYKLTSFFEHIRGRRRRGCAATYGPATFSLVTWNQHDIVDFHERHPDYAQRRVRQKSIFFSHSDIFQNKKNKT